MDLGLLRTFVTVHRAGSFTRAARLLGLSQPAVTGQIRALERQLGRPLFLRLARGVSATAIADELAHKMAPHLDALLEIAETVFHSESALPRTLHLAGPPEFTTLRVLPALAPLAAEGCALRVALDPGEQALAALADGRYDLVIAAGRPRGRLLQAAPLWDEEQVLVASPSWAARTGPAGGRPEALDEVPIVGRREELPRLVSFWAEVFGTVPKRGARVVAPDLRAVLECVRHDAGMAVLPRYLCAEALAAGELVPLAEPRVPPLRTYFLVVRTGTLALPHLAWAHERLLSAARHW